MHIITRQYQTILTEEISLHLIETYIKLISNRYNSIIHSFSAKGKSS